MTYDQGSQCQIPNLPEILLDHLGYKTDGRYIEVGAFDGINWSNTHPLAKIGWKGIAIEPHIDHYNNCVVNLKRYDVKVLRCAIADYEGEGELYLAGSLSTLYDETVLTYRSFDWASYLFPPDIKRQAVQIRTLDGVLEEQRWAPGFDLLVIDVEGGELEVLKGFSINYWQPKMMIVETHADYPDRGLSYKGRVIGAMLDFYGYREIYADYINSIYKKEP